jgi:hypothetical protein
MIPRACKFLKTAKIRECDTWLAQPIRSLHFYRLHYIQRNLFAAPRSAKSLAIRCKMCEITRWGFSKPNSSSSWMCDWQLGFNPMLKIVQNRMHYMKPSLIAYLTIQMALVTFEMQYQLAYMWVILSTDAGPNATCSIRLRIELEVRGIRRAYARKTAFHNKKFQLFGVEVVFYLIVIDGSGFQAGSSASLWRGSGYW